MHRNSQFMERLFTLLMSGAYGAVMIWMFASHYLGWNSSRGERSILSLVTTWIQYTILIGGIALVALFFILLFNLRKAGDGHHHSHEPVEGDGHEHCDKEGCDHDHHHAHDHKHEHGDQHFHNHQHDHKHTHSHDGHECCDHGHDHGWNPIRYIPLLVPLILILMGLPDTRMIESFEKHRIDLAMQESKRVVVNEQMCWMMLGSFSGIGEVFPQIGFSTSFASGVQSILDELDDEAQGVNPVVTDLGQLEKVAQNPALMQQYEAFRKLEVEGMFQLQGKDNVYTYFQVVRLRMACCLTDSKPAMMLARTRKDLPAGLQEKASGSRWVKVQGRVKFGQAPDGKYHPYFKVVKVEQAPMPPFPYLS